MGTHVHSAVVSNRLREMAETARDLECFDMTSTAGYDNDGSTGPELIDNGMDLAFSAIAYDKEATVFWAIAEHGPRAENVAVYQYGKDEDDAIRRLEANGYEEEPELNCAMCGPQVDELTECDNCSSYFCPDCISGHDCEDHQ